METNETNKKNETNEANEATEYQRFIAETHLQLGISESFFKNLRLSLEVEPEQLKSVGLDVHGRRQWAASHVILPLKQLIIAARKDGVRIGVTSAFWSVQYQFFLIQRKLSQGLFIENILQSTAPPGYSEHHSGEAIDFVDLATHPHSTLNKQFENTKTFSWLEKEAQHFGFIMSFPRDNEYGIVYEPWHWRFAHRPSATRSSGLTDGP